MFSKSKDSGKKVEHPVSVKSSPPSIISADLRIVGDLSCEGEIQVDGTIDGDIRTKDLLIGDTAVINGEIVADTVRVHGTVNGQIKARNVILSQSAKVIGDILHEDLAIESGAFLEGLCKRVSETKDRNESKVNIVAKDPAASSASLPKGNEAAKKSAL